MKNSTLLMAEAKKYAGFKDLTNPYDEDERYYNSHKCAIYDAVLYGITLYEEYIAKKTEGYTREEIIAMCKRAMDAPVKAHFRLSNAQKNRWIEENLKL